MNGIPDRRRLGELAVRHVRLECRQCRRRVVLSRAALRAVWGARARLCWIADDMRCTACGGIGARLSFPVRAAPKRTPDAR